MAIFFSVELHAPSFVMKMVYFREKKSAITCVMSSI